MTVVAQLIETYTTNIATFLGSYRSKTCFNFLKSIWVCSVAKKNHLTLISEEKPINIAFSLQKQEQAHVRVHIHLSPTLNDPTQFTHIWGLLSKNMLLYNTPLFAMCFCLPSFQASSVPCMSLYHITVSLLTLVVLATQSNFLLVPNPHLSPTPEASSVYDRPVGTLEETPNTCATQYVYWLELSDHYRMRR